jgi:hypothetical protein
MILDTDKLAIQGAIKTSNLRDYNDAKIVRIKNTLELEYIYFSESLLEEAKASPYLEILSEPEYFDFNDKDNLF